MSRPRPLAPAERRRVRWLARVLVAVDAAPDAYREAVIDVARRLSSGDLHGPDADALADTLGGLIYDALEYEPNDPG